MIGSNVDDKDDYISSYNYFIYYNSIKPRDPRLPLPKWKPQGEHDYLKTSHNLDNKIQEMDEPENTIDLGNNEHFDIKDDSNLSTLMNNMNLGFEMNMKMQQNAKTQEKDGFLDFNHGMFGVSNQPKMDNSNFNLNQSEYYGGMNKDKDLNNMFMGGYGNQMNQMNSMGQINPMNSMNPMNQMSQMNHPLYMNPNMSNYYGMNSMNNEDFSQMRYDSYQPNMNMMSLGNKGFSNMPNNNFFNPQQMYPTNMNNQNMDMYQHYMRQGQGIYMGGVNNMQNFNPYFNKQMNVGQMPNTKKSSIKGNMDQMKQKQEKTLDTTNVNDLLPNLIEFCKDHSGSRLVQKRYEEGTDEDKEKIFDKLEVEILPLAKDVFGNYVIQKILDFSNASQRKSIIKKMKGKIHELAMHMYGCRVIQKAIDLADVDDILDYLEELSDFIIKSIEDQNGNHVIQKLIERLPRGEHNDILNAIKGRVYDLSIHQYGCRVIQRLFEYCKEEEKEEILKEIYHRVLDLCMNQYGNYVIQHIIEKQSQDKVSKIFEDIKGSIFEMSIHKFAR